MTTTSPSRSFTLRRTTFGLALVLAGCGPRHVTGPAAPPAPAHQAIMHSIIPVPVEATVDPSVHFTITEQTRIVVDPGNEAARHVGSLLSELVGTAAKTPLQVVSPGGAPAADTISLRTGAGNAALGAEGYELTVAADRITIAANEPAGLFYGVQTLRQLMPASIEYRAALARPVPVPGAHVIDHPRFAWRGAMLDVARHFFGVRDVKRYIDLIALYKMNHLHLHLTDDQGWRIEIKSWPNLAEHGGRTAVWGGTGGYYTQQDYADIVRYAAERFVTIVPEIEMPSHSNAALASYPELNCDDKAPGLYSGIDVGFSSFCVDKDVTYRFLTDVIKEVAAMTPGPYIHVGGDEVKTLTPAQYKQFMERAQAIVASAGKQAIGWDEMAHIDRLPTTIVQHWRPEFTGSDTADMKLVLSPAEKIYLDMKYDRSTPVGLDWAARIEVREAYDWEPTTFAKVPESAIVGIEAPLWSETLRTMSDVEYMAFPRLAGAAEIAWSAAGARHWDEYRLRLGAQAPRWSALGINYYRSPQVPWVEPGG